MIVTAANSHAATMARRWDTQVRTSVRVAVCALVVVAASCSSSSATTTAMDEMWSSRDDAERAGFCAEVRTDGLTESIATFMAAEPDFDRAAVREWLTDTCEL